MTKETSFSKQLAVMCSKNEVLRQPNDTKVKIKVSAIIAFCQRFHEVGYEDGKKATPDLFSSFFR